MMSSQNFKYSFKRQSTDCQISPDNENSEFTSFLKKEDFSTFIISTQNNSKNEEESKKNQNSTKSFESLENLSFRSICSDEEIIEKVNVPKKTHQGCKCKNSKCLRLHCSCFKNLGYCSPSCKCLDCLNSKEYDTARSFVIEKTKLIYKNAFSVKITKFKGFSINKEGCNCTKNCDSKYCGCKRLGVFCSPLCKCDSCVNSKLKLDKKEILKKFRPPLRKKHKIIFDLKGSGDKDIDNTNIVFEVYKKSKTTFN